MCLQELTLSRYFAVEQAGAAAGGVVPEELPGGPTYAFAAEMARETGAHVHASLYERADGEDGLGYNTAILVAPGRRARHAHAQAAHPGDAGYYEDRYFRPGPAGADAFPVATAGRALGFPTCWDQWFPEPRARYTLDGADVLVYPTAIGSEPDHPGLRHRAAVGAGDDRPRDRQRRRSSSRSNRIGDGAAAARSTARRSSATPTAASSCRRRATSPRCSLADLDLDQRRDWLELFPFLTTRRPDAYAALAEPRREDAGRA